MRGAGGSELGQRQLGRPSSAVRLEPLPGPVGDERETNRKTRERGSEGKGKEEGKEESEMGGPGEGKKRRGRRKKRFREWEQEGGREEGD